MANIVPFLQCYFMAFCKQAENVSTVATVNHAGNEVRWGWWCWYLGWSTIMRRRWTHSRHFCSHAELPRVSVLFLNTEILSICRKRNIFLLFATDPWNFQSCQLRARRQGEGGIYFGIPARVVKIGVVHIAGSGKIRFFRWKYFRRIPIQLIFCDASRDEIE